MKTNLYHPIGKISFMVFLITGLFGFMLFPSHQTVSINQLSSIVKPMDCISDKDYETLWREVSKLQREGKSKEVKTICQQIYDKAEKEQNEGQLLRALLFIYKIEHITEEHSESTIVKDLYQRIEKAEQAQKAVLQSILAELYWQYFSANAWRIKERSSSTSNEKDFLTWDANRFHQEIQELYLTALEPAKILQEISINDFDPIIQHQENSQNYRPSLYDLLSHQAIDFFKNSFYNYSTTKPADQFQVVAPELFSDPNSFANYKLDNERAVNNEYHILKIYQDLTKFHLFKKGDKTALLALSLDRMQFVYTNSILTNKEDLYLSALKKLESIAPENAFTAMIAYYRAKVHLAKGENYHPKRNPEWRYKNQKALEICQKAIKQLPDSEQDLTTKCKNLIITIEQKSITTQINSKYLPEKPILASVDYRNCTQLFGRSILLTDELKLQLKALKHEYTSHSLHQKALLELLSQQEIVKEWAINLPDEGLYHKHTTQFKIPTHTTTGEYYFLHSDSQDFNTATAYTEATSTFITNLAGIADINKSNDKLKIYSLDAHTGQSLSNVAITISKKFYNKKTLKYEYLVISELTSNENKLGVAQVTIPTSKEYNYDSFLVELKTNNDYYKFETRSNSPITPQTSKQKLELFTDRSIYRPGQTVHFKGILYTQKPDQQHHIIADQKIKVKLMDANRQKVSEVELISNEFGSIKGTFDLPTQLLNGRFSIQSTYGNCDFNVEEYKRPKFQVNIDPVEGSFKLNEIVKITGNAQTYAGNKVDNAKVKYRIVRKTYFPYWVYSWSRPQPYSPQIEIQNGFATTDEKGQFELSFKALPDLSISPEDKPQFQYDIIINITDLNGETQTAQKTLSIAYTSLLAKVEIPQQIDKAATKTFPISTTNLEGQFESAEVTIQIQKLVAPNRLFRKWLFKKVDTFTLSKEAFIQDFPNDIYDNENEYDNWEKGKIVFQKQLQTSTESTINLNDLETWELGTYMLTLNSQDQYGTPIESQQIIHVFSFEEEHVPDNQLFWHQLSHETIEPGEVLSIACGSAAKDANILLSIVFKDQVIKEEWIKVSEAQQIIKVKIKEEWRGNFQVSLSMVKFNRFHHFEKTITVPWTNKKLDIAVKTFRTKLLPGQEEKWTITIKGMDGDQVAAELMTTLYDASLDVLKKHNWSFNPYTKLNYYNRTSPNYNHHYFAKNKDIGFINFNWNKSLLKDNHQYYDRLNLHGASITTYKPYLGIDLPFNDIPAEYATITTTRADGSTRTEQVLVKEASHRLGLLGTMNTIGSYEMGDTNALPIPPIRKNLQETAFFFPDIKTNEQGEFVLSFTSPEALTTWKWMSIAHTKDLKIGTLLEEAVTQKDLMVFPNPPRFFRENDTIWFSAKVSNLAKKALIGTVKLELFDALTMQPIDTKLANNNPEQNIKLKEGQSDAVSWQLVIPKGIQVVTWRVTAQAGNFTDGEENTLPVLTNRQLVTESMPLAIRGNQIKQFSFDNLQKADQSNTLTHQGMTLEFTSQPAWYAIQALPYLMEYPHQCTEQIASRYYANALAAHIANSDPKIKKVFDSWKEEQVTATKSSDPVEKEALLSNLQKNQDLKSLLLEETPWVMAAKSENERKQRLAILFDIKRMSQELKGIEQKLKERQASNGGWSWFPGMRESWYISQHILTNFGHLQKLGVKQDRAVGNMLNSAVNFIDQEMYKHYQDLKNNDRLNKEYFDRMAGHYLYARSFFKDIPIKESHQEAVDYFLKNNAQYWSESSLYTQAMAAISLHRWKNGDSQVAKDIMESFRQNAVQNEEMGMYYKANVGGWHWYNAPIETQALIIEAFDEVEDDLETMKELRIWLLKQKQTQDWETTIATVKACNALLLRGTNWINSEELADISIGSQKLDPHNMPEVAVEAGTGYFKKQWQAEAITPDMKNITVSKKDESIGWGAVYWQYFEDLDKITRAETPLAIEKELFKEVYTKNGPQLDKLADGAALEVGDKVKVRIVIRVDRDMEYVHLKDMRAAAFEPMNVISRYKYQDGLGYYESTKDAATNFFMDRLPKGTYVFEYPLRVAQKGDFSNGITTIQCMYAPEFTSHSEGVRVKVR